MKQLFYSIALASVFIGCTPDSSQIKVDLKNLSMEDFETLKNLETAGEGESCAIRSEVAIGAGKTELVCRKNKSLTTKGESDLQALLNKYGVQYKK